MPLRFLTAGESHGPALNVIVEGLPAGVPVDREEIDRELRRRMGGYGRGGRMKIEKDRVEVLGGVRFGLSLGSPVSLMVRNLDHENWTREMNPDGPHPGTENTRSVTRPRPGHADLAGALKYGTYDARDILERASARETTVRTAAGALARRLLSEAGIDVTSCTVAVGRVQVPEIRESDFDRLVALPDDAPMRTVDDEGCRRLIEAVEQAQAARDSIGGVFEVLVRGAPAGLGSHVHWDRRLDGRLGGAVMSIQAVKAVSVGEGITGAEMFGSELHDPILHDDGRGFHRPSNRAGGVEGGISNGEMIRVRGYLKPLASLPKPLASADLVTKEPFEAARERTDTIPIVAAGVVGEAMVSLIVADELLIKFGGDRLDETLRNLAAYRAALKAF